MTTRQRVLMLGVILGLATMCGWEAMGLHLWNTLAFGLMAVACAAMFMVQVGEEKKMQTYRRYGATWSVFRLHPARDYIGYRSLLFSSILRHGERSGWTWRVKS